eukprot:gene7432-6968_t
MPRAVIFLAILGVATAALTFKKACNSDCTTCKDTIEVTPNQCFNDPSARNSSAIYISTPTPRPRCKCSEQARCVTGGSLHIAPRGSRGPVCHVGARGLGRCLGAMWHVCTATGPSGDTAHVGSPGRPVVYKTTCVTCSLGTITPARQ